jgi:hypothetical protein
MRCLSIEQLLAWAQNQLPADARERIEHHLKSACQACRKELGDLHESLVTEPSRRSSQPPDWLIHQAMNLFHWYMVRPHQMSERRIPAFLLVDTLAEGAAPGFRRVNPMNKQMLYRAGDYDIDLFIECLEPAHTVDIVGQIMPLSADLSAVAGATIKLLRKAVVEMDTKTNGYGEFTLRGVTEGVYDLNLEMMEAAIDIVELNAVIRPH